MINALFRLRIQLYAGDDPHAVFPSGIDSFFHTTNTIVIRYGDV